MMDIHPYILLSTALGMIIVGIVLIVFADIIRDMIDRWWQGKL